VKVAPGKTGELYSRLGAEVVAPEVHLHEVEGTLRIYDVSPIGKAMVCNEQRCDTRMFHDANGRAYYRFRNISGASHCSAWYKPTKFYLDLSSVPHPITHVELHLNVCWHDKCADRDCK